MQTHHSCYCSFLDNRFNNYCNHLLRNDIINRLLSEKNKLKSGNKYIPYVLSRIFRLLYFSLFFCDIMCLCEIKMYDRLILSSAVDMATNACSGLPLTANGFGMKVEIFSLLKDRLCIHNNKSHVIIMM